MTAPDQIGRGFGTKALGIPLGGFPGGVHRQRGAAWSIAPVAARQGFGHPCSGQASPGHTRAGLAAIALPPRGARAVAEGAVAEGALPLGLISKAVCGGAIAEGTIGRRAGGTGTGDAGAGGTGARDTGAGTTGAGAKAALTTAAAGVAAALAAAPILTAALEAPLPTTAVGTGAVGTRAITASSLATEPLARESVATGPLARGPLSTEAVTAGSLATGSICTEAVAAKAIPRRSARARRTLAPAAGPPVGTAFKTWAHGERVAKVMDCFPSSDLAARQADRDRAGTASRAALRSRWPVHKLPHRRCAGRGRPDCDRAAPGLALAH